jgi:hypothetical protein
MSNVEPLPAPDRGHARAAARSVPVAGVGIIFAGTMTMTVDDWIAVPDNPVQRDTERHARKATHLHTLHPTHQVVDMARLPNGQQYKADAHSRAFLWDGRLAGEGIRPQRPRLVTVKVWACQNLSDVKRLYDTCDSKAAVETLPDKLHGAQREIGLTFNSTLLKSGRYGQAVKNLYQKVYGYEDRKRPDFLRICVTEFVDDLRRLDDCNPSQGHFPFAITMAALATIRAYGEQAVDFWKGYEREAGWKMDGDRDPIQALHEALQDTRARKQIDSQHQWELMGRAVNAVEMAARSGTYKGRIKKKSAAQLDGFLKTLKTR